MENTDLGNLKFDYLLKDKACVYLCVFVYDFF